MWARIAVTGLRGHGHRDHIGASPGRSWAPSALVQNDLMAHCPSPLAGHLQQTGAGRGGGGRGDSGLPAGQRGLRRLSDPERPGCTTGVAELRSQRQRFKEAALHRKQMAEFERSVRAERPYCSAQVCDEAPLIRAQ